jgi:tetratricopeptide (TPR) repeat protein
MYAADGLKFPRGQSVLRSLIISCALLGLAACAVGPDTDALQPPPGDEAGAQAEATEASLVVLGMLSRGAEALATGDAPTALTFLDQAVEAGGDDATALFLRGVAHLEIGDAAAAGRDLERAIELKPDDVAAYCALARARRLDDDLEGAVEAVTQAVELSPDDARLLTLQGHMLIEAGHIDEAHEVLQKAAGLDPQNVETQRTLGILYTEAGDSAAAEQAWRAALELAPDDVMLHAGLASCLRDEGRDDEALDSYREAIRLEPENPVHRANLASTCYRLGRLDEARDAYQASLALEALPPHSHSFVALNYGVVLERLGDDQGAIDAYEESIDNDAERAEAHEALGLLLLDRGQEQSAYDHLGAAFDLELVSPEAVLHLGLLADKLGVPERARQCAALLDAWEESDVAVAYRRAQLLVRCHDPEVHDGPTAIGILEELVDGPLSSSAAAWNMLAEALVGEGRFDDALKATDRALELVEPGDPAWNRSRDLREHCLLSLVGP